MSTDPLRQRFIFYINIFILLYILYLVFKILTYPILSYICLDPPDHGTFSTDPLTDTVVTLIYILCTYYLKMATDRAETCSK
jgi:hypothetical protein